MKGLPLSFSKDMQEDKEATFDAIDTYSLIVATMTGMVKDMKVNKDEMLASTTHGFITATDLLCEMTGGCVEPP